MADFLDADKALARITVQNRNVTGDLAEAIIGTPSVSFSITQVSQVSLDIRDPDFNLLRSGLFTSGSTFGFDGERLEVAVLETGGTVSPMLTIKARSRGVQTLKREKGEKVWSGVSPTAVAKESAQQAGLSFKGQDSPSRASIARASKDSSGNEEQTQWELLRDLAAQEGFVLFEVAETLYFGKPTWLLDNADVTWRLGFPDRPGTGARDIYPLTIPQCRRSSNDEDDAVEITFSVPWSVGVDMRPGHALSLSGLPTFSGDYLIDSVTIPVDGSTPVEVQVSTPIDPDPQEQAADPVSDDLGVPDFLGEGSPGSVDFGDAPVIPTTFSGDLIWPVKGVVTSEFGPRGGRNHNGIDIGGNNRQRIVAAADGIVTRSAYSDSYGWVVYLDHSIANDASVRLLETRYAHMFQRPAVSGWSYDKKTGRPVKTHVRQGQTIGFVGSTGRSTGPHLHFEVRFRSSGAAINPRTRLSGKPPSTTYVPPDTVAR